MRRYYQSTQKILKYRSNLPEQGVARINQKAAASACLTSVALQTPVALSSVPPSLIYEANVKNAPDEVKAVDTVSY